jgi:hypothetical protein
VSKTDFFLFGPERRAEGATNGLTQDKGLSAVKTHREVVDCEVVSTASRSGPRGRRFSTKKGKLYITRRESRITPVGLKCITMGPNQSKGAKKTGAMKDWRPPVQPDRYTLSGEVGSRFFLSAKVIIYYRSLID